jgi:hypothetical protein
VGPVRRREGSVDVPGGGGPRPNAGRKTKLNARTQALLCQIVRAGGTYFMAAEAAGVSRTAFQTWLVRGEQEPDSVYGELVYAIREARAQARIAAEIAAYRNDYRFWLTKGPGKGGPGGSEENWTDRLEIVGDPTKPTVQEVHVRYVGSEPAVSSGNGQDASGE